MKINNEKTHTLKGEEVKLIQTALQKMDIDIGESGVDGIYGNDGHYAVMLFQENYEPTHKTHKYAWNEPDGIVGKNTLLAMDEALVAGWKYIEKKVKETPWMVTAKSQLGVKEVPGATSNPTIIEYYKAANYRPLGIKKFNDMDDSKSSNAWCACFVSWVMKQHNYKLPIGPAASKSWKTFGKKIDEPVYGAIAIKSRIGGGHVAFILGKSSDGNHYYVLGGNQNDEVNVRKYSKDVWTTFVIPEDYDETQQILPMYQKSASNAGKES